MEIVTEGRPRAEMEDEGMDGFKPGPRNLRTLVVL